MKKTILVLLTTLFTLNPSLITHHSSQFALSEDIFDLEVEKEIIEEGRKAQKDWDDEQKKKIQEKKDAEERSKKEKEENIKKDAERKKQEELAKKKEAEEKKKGKSKVNTSNNKTAPQGMVFVEGGSFDMGDNTSSNTKPIHKVSVSSFYISKYETTQAEYQNIMGKNPSSFKGSNLPVETVSWFDAIKYCNAKSKKEGLAVAYSETTGDLLDSSGNVTSDITKVSGYRLPTEAEWEYAARGGNKSQGYTYSGGNSPDEIAVYEENSYKKRKISIDYGTHIVGSKKSNELGIYDMTGNVWEWCTDFYDDGYYNNSTNINPVNTKSSDSRVYRGGSWGSSPDRLRIGTRFYSIFANDYVGFRLARTGG